MIPHRPKGRWGITPKRWQADNVSQLVSDLQDACTNPDSPYFLGSLILVRDGSAKYQVIDGRRRLISLSIIISVLRDLETDPDLIGSLNDLILEPGDKLRGIKAQPRLRLRERDTYRSVRNGACRCGRPSAWYA